MKKLAIIIATILVAASCTGGYQPTEKTFTVNSTVNAYFTFIRVKENEQPFHNVIAARRSDEELCVMLSLVGGFTGSVYDLMDDPYGTEAQALLALCHNTSLTVDSGVHCRLRPTVAHGFNLLNHICQLHQTTAAGE